MAKKKVVTEDAVEIKDFSKKMAKKSVKKTSKKAVKKVVKEVFSIGLTIRLTTKQHKLIKTLAKKEKKSLSEYTRYKMFA